MLTIIQHHSGNDKTIRHKRGRSNIGGAKIIINLWIKKLTTWKKSKNANDKLFTIR